MRQVAVVTGGAGALGRAVVRAFDAAGYEVFLNAVSDEELGNYSGPGQIVVVDLADLGAAKAWLDKIGKPVNAATLLAGGFSMRPLDELHSGDFEAQFRTNAKTAANTLTALAPWLFRAGSAAAVLVGSQAYEGAAGMALYAASKASVVSLAKSAALEWNSRGVRVNSILPDIIDTPSNREAMPKADFTKWAKPEELARILLFLCSPDAALISGNALRVSRGV